MSIEQAGTILAALAALAILLIAFAISRHASDAELERRIDRFGSRQRDPGLRADVDPTFASTVAGSKAVASVGRLVEGRRIGASLSRRLGRADLRLRVSEFLILWAVAMIVVPLILVSLSVIIPNLRHPLLLLGAILVGAMLPHAWVGRRERQRLNAFNDQLADAITLIANALRSGSSFLQACELATRESPPPVSTEFARLIREVNMGVPFDESMRNMVERMRSSDLELLATAIVIQYQVGGNLAEVLDSIAFTIRERVRIKGEIRTLTAQQRLSGLILGLLPVGLLAFLFTVSPRFLAPMFETPPEVLGLPLGVFLLGLGALMMVFGFLTVRRVSDVDV